MKVRYKLFLIVSIVSAAIFPAWAQDYSIDIRSLDGVRDGDTVVAGDTLKLTLNVFNGDTLKDIDKFIVHTRVNPPDQIIEEYDTVYYVITNRSGIKANFEAQVRYRYNVDGELDGDLIDTFSVYVKPDKEHRLSIERVGYDLPTNLSSTRILLPRQQAYRYQAVFYDRFNNRIGPANNVLWAREKSGILEHTIGDSATISFLTTSAFGTTQIVAQDTAGATPLSDTLNLHVPSEWSPQIDFGRVYSSMPDGSDSLFKAPQDAVAGQRIAANLALVDAQGRTIPGSWIGEVRVRNAFELPTVYSDETGLPVKANYSIGGQSVELGNSVKTGAVDLEMKLFITLFKKFVPDSHQLIVSIEDKEDTTDIIPLRIDPKKILVSHNGDMVSGLVHSGDVLNLGVKGKDLYGNTRREYCDFSTGQLLSLEDLSNADSVRMVVDSVKDDHFSYLMIQSTRDRRLKDSLPVFIKGWGAHLLSAKTVDSNGNGLIDGVQLRFDETVSDSRGDQFDLMLSYPHEHKTFYLEHESITKKDSILSVSLIEEESELSDLFQNDWQPYLTISGFDSIANVKEIIVDDGVAPSLWYVSIQDDRSSPESQIVRIAFSSPVDTVGESQNWSNLLPSELISIWQGGENIDTILDNATSVSLINRQLVQFSTASRLTDDHMVSLKAHPLIKDANGNKAGDTGYLVAVIDEEGLPSVVEDSTQTTEEDPIRRNCGDCGTGVELAFLVPVWLRVRKIMGRKRS